MNLGKVGEPYDFQIPLLDPRLHGAYFHLPYRQTGFAHAIPGIPL